MNKQQELKDFLYDIPSWMKILNEEPTKQKMSYNNIKINIGKVRNGTTYVECVYDGKYCFMYMELDKHKNELYIMGDIFNIDNIDINNPKFIEIISTTLNKHFIDKLEDLHEQIEFFQWLRYNPVKRVN